MNLLRPVSGGGGCCTPVRTRWVLALCLFLPLAGPGLGCTAPRGDQAATHLAKEFDVVEGRLLAPPDMEASGHRMLLVLERSDGERVVAVTYNAEEKHVLTDLAGHLVESDATIVLYGSHTNGDRWREYQDGIDFYFDAIAFYRPVPDRYFIVVTGYGDRLQDVLTAGGWKGFLSRVTSLASKAL